MLQAEDQLRTSRFDFRVVAETKLSELSEVAGGECAYGGAYVSNLVALSLTGEHA